MPSNGVFFKVPIEPVPFARAGTNGVRRFTPTKQANFMGQIRVFADRAMNGRPPLQGALSMSVEFIYTPPKSWSKKKIEQTLWKTSAPDTSNLVKIVEDALNGCVYEDDAQIALSTISKMYGAQDAINVLVTPLDNLREQVDVRKFENLIHRYAEN